MTCPLNELAGEVGSAGSVLLVDDEAELLSAFEHAFGDEFNIWTATNAEDAFEIFKRYSLEVDVVVADQRMPGETGIEFLGRVKSLAPQKPCFLATAYSDLDVLKSAINTGCVDQFISKPWDPRALNRQIKGVIRRSKERDLSGRNEAQAAASLMAIQVGTASIVQLGIAEMCEPYLRSLEVFTGAVGTYYYGGRDAVLESDVHRMLANLRACSLHAIDMAGCDEKASTVSMRESLASVITELRTAGEAQQVRFKLSVCEPDPQLYLDAMIWRELLKLIMRNEFLYVPSGAQLQISVNLQTRDSRVTSLELSFFHRSVRATATLEQDQPGSFDDLAQTFAQQLLASILGVEILADQQDRKVSPARTVTVKLPADLISL